MTDHTPRLIDELAAIIRRVDGSHDLGAAALAEKLVEAGVRVVFPVPDENLTLAVPEDAETQHNHPLLPFGRRLTTCPRCVALEAGTAQPRPGWKSRRLADERLAAEIRTHSCATAGCGPVCTHGDW